MRRMMIVHPKVIAEAGRRDRKTPAFLSRKQVRCPRCGRMEYGNVSQERLVMCSLCTMGLSIAKPEKVNSGVKEEAPPPKLRAFRQRRQPRLCERCGEEFRGRSNSQKFCEACQRGARNEKTAARTRKWRKGQNGPSLVTQ